jgi:hypothetical protein
MTKGTMIISFDDVAALFAQMMNSAQSVDDLVEVFSTDFAGRHFDLNL